MNRHTPMLPEHDVRETPPALFAALDAKHSFTLDACATHHNALCNHYCTEGGTFEKSTGGPIYRSPDDGLSFGAWKDHRVFCNPPYTMIPEFIEQAWGELADRVVMLIPATRTEQPWWHEMVEPYRDLVDGSTMPAGGWAGLTVDFIPGRVKFLENGGPIYRRNKDGSFYLHPLTGQKVISSPKFGCCTLTWRR